MRYKVLAFDIDGTLTNSKKDITPLTKEAIKKAAACGCKIVIASGRPAKGIERYRKELELDNIGGYLLPLNGGMIVEAATGNILNSRFVPHEYYEEIYRLSKENNVNIMTYDGDAVISENTDDKYVDIEAVINGLEKKQVDNLLEYLDYEVPKFLMVGDGEYLAQVEKKVHEALCDRLEVYRSEPFFLEILPKNVDKAKSLEVLLDKLGYSREELITFGDGFNDITMIEYAGMGVAMGNAKDAVKQSADYITGTNDEDGIVDVINKFVLS